MTDAARRRLLSAGMLHTHTRLVPETSVLVLNLASRDGLGLVAALSPAQREAARVVVFGCTPLAVIVLGVAELPLVLGRRWPDNVSPKPLASPEVRVACVSDGVTLGVKLAQVATRRCAA